MSDSVDAIGSVVPMAGMPEITHPVSIASPTTSGYADATMEMPEGDGTVVITVTDAQGEVISATTIQPHAAAAPTKEPAHLLSIEI